MNDDVQPHIHYTTTNISALKCYDFLKKLGVKNNKFVLTLYDTDLLDIDPYADNLPSDIQHKIHLEVQRNYWYFLREIVRFNIPGGKIKFNFHRGNIAISWLLLNNINTYLELPRQNGKTSAVAAYYAWVYGFRTINSKSSAMSKDPESVKNNLNDIVTILENCPKYLQMIDRKTDRINKEFISSPFSNNVIQTRTPPGTLEQATNKGRGSREPLQWFDEMPFIKFIKEITLNSAPAFSEAAKNAKMNDSPYSRIFTSTPGILGTPEGDFVHDEFLSQSVYFNEKLFYDQPSYDDLLKLIYSESKNDVVYVIFNYKQLGRGEDYFEKQCRDLNNNRDAIEREVLLKWSRRALDSPFTKEQLDRVAKYIKAPIGSILIKNRYVLKFFKKPDFTKKYVIGVDCSGMLNNDYSSVTVTDPQTFEPVATLRSNARDSYSNTSTFGEAIADIALQIFKNALVVIEKNNMGIAVIDNILDRHPELIDRLYSSALEPYSEAKNIYGYKDTASDANVIRYDGRVIVYGFDTTKIRREQMFSEILGIVITELYDCVNDNDIFLELNGIVKRNGRLDHRLGKHDDMLFSWLISLWVLCYSKILTTKYDYQIGYVRPMSILESSEKQLTSEDFKNMNENKNIDVIVNKFTHTNANKQLSQGRVGNSFVCFDKSVINPDGLNFRQEDKAFNTNTASISEIGNYLFSGDNIFNFEDEEEPEIDVNTNIEDNYQYSKSLNVAERETFEKMQENKYNSKILKAKNNKHDNYSEIKKSNAETKIKNAIGNKFGDIDDKSLNNFIESFLK